MRGALRLASLAARRGEVPVGCVALLDGEVIAGASNRIEKGGDATLHAEMILLRRLARQRPNWRLEGITIVVTLEPCPMCAAAMVQARIDRCVYGARDPKKGADGSVYDVLRHAQNNWKVEVVEGVLASECGQVLSEFFQKRRRAKA